MNLAKHGVQHFFIYGPALGSKVKKNPASIADSGKNRKNARREQIIKF
jgi:hypothetical protein